GVLLNVAVTVVFLLTTPTDNSALVFMRLLELNTIVFALYGITWLSLQPLWRRSLTATESTFAQQLFKIQVSLAALGLIAILIPLAIRLILWPYDASVMSAGSSYQWISLVATVIASLWFLKSYNKSMRAGALAAVITAFSILLALSSVKFQFTGWDQYLVLMFLLAGTAWLMLASKN